MQEIDLGVRLGRIEVGIEALRTELVGTIKDHEQRIRHVERFVITASTIGGILITAIGVGDVILKVM